MVKVVLDPGHYKNYNKGVVAGYYEGNYMFEYAYTLKGILESKYEDVVVDVTRKTITDNPTLSQRGKMGAGADLLLSLHSNAANPTGKGVSVFYSIKRPEDKALADTWCYALAAIINGGTTARGGGGMTRKGSGDWDYYTVIQSASATDCKHVMIVEHGFHSDPEECAWLLRNLQLMAETEAGLIADALNLQPIKEDKPPENGWYLAPDNRWYHYQNGKMQRGQWLKANEWYYLMNDGTMAVGWAYVNGNWFYLDPENGDMKTGWLNLNDGTYYLKESGVMVTGVQVIDGKRYEFDNSGRLKK